MDKETKEFYKQYDYATLVQMFIGERYSISDELALHRQRDTKPDEWEAYDTYCEECKAKAKEILD